MRLRAIRLKEVGCFLSGVALEGLGDGLNVLAGPNELGKSTLLKALRMVLQDSHTSASKTIAVLQPYQGGSPLVEIEFDTAGARWRLRKQYLSAKSAELAELGGSGQRWRGNDVQDRLDELLRGKAGLNGIELLWVTQRDGLGAAEKKRDGLEELRHGDTLSRLIADEIDTIAIDDDARRVHASVRAALDEYRTAKTGKPRKGGPWQAALDACETTERAAAIARERLAALDDRLSKLASLVAERETLQGPTGLSAFKAALATATEQLASVATLRLHERTATQVLETAKLKLDGARRAADDFAKADLEWATLETDVANARKARETVAGRIAQLKAEFAPLEIAQHAARSALDTLDAELTTARNAEADIHKAAERDRLQRRLDDLRSALADRDVAGRIALGHARITPQAIDALDAAEREHAVLEAKLAAIAPEITIALAPGGAGKMRIGGTPIGADIAMHPAEPVEIVIDGIGRIRVAPNPATAGPDAQSARAVARARVKDQLDAIGVASLAEGRKRMAEKIAAEQAQNAAAKRAQALAPEGIDGLVSAIAEFAHLPHEPPRTTRPTVAIEQDVAAARKRLAELDGSVHARTISLSQLAERLAGVEATLAGLSEQLAAMTARRGATADAQKAKDAAEKELRGAQSAFADATQVLAGLHAKLAELNAPALEAKAIEARTKYDDAQKRLHDLDIAIHEHEAVLVASSDEDIEAECARCADAASQAKSALDAIEEDIAALSLLDKMFADLAASGRDNLSAPIHARIAPYLGAVLPGASIGFDEQMAPDRLIRGTRLENLDRLSQGTREQIAILTRLGLGKLLAEQGETVPVILDDALVFADDGRIARMFAVLAEASLHQQVIVLTCREQAFTPLALAPGAKSLSLSPWSG